MMVAGSEPRELISESVLLTHHQTQCTRIFNCPEKLSGSLTLYVLHIHSINISQ